MKVWVSADHHFGHANIIKYENRPYENQEKMNEDLIQKWNETVESDDIVYYLGDFAMRNQTLIDTILPQLNGHKYLMQGNHDFHLTKKKWREKGFEKTLNETKQPDEYILVEWGGITFALSHRPIYDLPYPNVHGHVHSKIDHLDQSKHLCISVECTDYRPLSIEEVIKWGKNFPKKDL